MFVLRFSSCNGLKYHKIRYKLRGNNAIKPFLFQFTCAQPVFLLLWFLEMYLLKGAKSLSEETEAVFTAL